jgi:hypothetical protein
MTTREIMAAIAYARLTPGQWITVAEGVLVQAGRLWPQPGQGNIRVAWRWSYSTKINGVYSDRGPGAASAADWIRKETRRIAASAPSL